MQTKLVICFVFMLTLCSEVENFQLQQFFTQKNSTFKLMKFKAWVKTRILASQNRNAHIWVYEGARNSATWKYFSTISLVILSYFLIPVTLRNPFFFDTFSNPPGSWTLPMPSTLWFYFIVRIKLFQLIKYAKLEIDFHQ